MTALVSVVCLLCYTKQRIREQSATKPHIPVNDLKIEYFFSSTERKKIKYYKSKFLLSLQLYYWWLIYFHQHLENCLNLLGSWYKLFLAIGRLCITYFHNKTLFLIAPIRDRSVFTMLAIVTLSTLSGLLGEWIMNQPYLELLNTWIRAHLQW
jgi:hypothetical protein